MGRPVVQTLAPQTAPSANGICLSQTPVAGGPLTLNGALVTGGVATLDAGTNVAHLVTITTAANDSARTFTVVGTGPDPGNPGNVIAKTQTVKGANVGTVSVGAFVTVTSISVDAATAGAITAGSGNAVAPTVPWDLNVRTKFEVSATGVTASAAPNWELDVTFDDVYNTAENLINWFPWANLQGKNGTAFDVISQPIRGSRFAMAGTGTLTGTQTQQGD